MAKQDYKQTMKGLSDKLKTDVVKIPIQEVRPVDVQPVITAPVVAPAPDPKPNKSEEAHFNFWADKSLMKRVKQHSVDSGMSIKAICIAALERYLPKK